MKTNSQTLLSPKLYLGDIDGDSKDEFIEVDGRHIYIFNCEHDHKPLLTHVFPHPVKRLIIGDFVTSGREKGKDQIFAILENGSIMGYAISNDLTEMWWWFTMPNFIANTEHFVVGDFDGDGADEILVYRPATGKIKIYEKKVNGVIGEMTNYSLGNMNSFNLKHKLLLAGNFGQANNRTDLLVIDKSAGQVIRFDTATDSNGVRTFWWAFNSRTRRFSKDDDLITANVDGGSKDALIVRKHSTGRYRIYKVEYNSGYMTRIMVNNIGQLPVKSKKGSIVAAMVRPKSSRREKGGTNRNDILYFNEANGNFIRTSARYDKNNDKLTYWWAYSSNIILEPQRSPLKRPWAVILCKWKGDTRDHSAIETFFKEIFTPGKGGIIEYWHDVSLGAIDISGSKVFGWVELDFKRDKANDKDRGQLVDAGIAACRRNGIEPVTGFHKPLAVFTDNFSKDLPESAPDDANWSHPTYGKFWIDGSATGSGKVSAPPHGHSGSFIAHEMGHGMGFDHDLEPDLSSHYGDLNCIMSAMRVRGFTHPKWQKTFGPAMSLPQLVTKNYMYDRRLYKPGTSWLSQSPVTFKLAPIKDRRITGYLGAILPVNASKDWDYYLEYQYPTGWDKGLTDPLLVIRRRKGNWSVYLGEIKSPKTKGGLKTFIEPSGNVRFQMKKIRNDERVIEVEVKKL